MNKQFLLFLGIALVLGLIYYQTNKTSDLSEIPEDEIAVDSERMEVPHDNENSDGVDEMIVYDDDVMEEKKDDQIQLITKAQGYDVYENKAIGYTINRPNNWYWEHFYVTQLTDAYPDVEDLFATQRSTLPALDSIYDSTIVIEVTATDKSTAMEGEDGVQHEGSKNGKNFVEYSYHIDGDRIIRFIYTAETVDDTELAVFEKVVKSYSL